ncbi:MAG: hypothetical protein OXP71_00720 [Candidatus Poribacteria bacterium]|nr:hypothetical protein [Candidatus Poribacteria bacterium]
MKPPDTKSVLTVVIKLRHFVTGEVRRFYRFFFGQSYGTLGLWSLYDVFSDGTFKD